jgi:hypothetical protein
MRLAPAFLLAAACSANAPGADDGQVTCKLVGPGPGATIFASLPPTNDRIFVRACRNGACDAGFVGVSDNCVAEKPTVLRGELDRAFAIIRTADGGLNLEVSFRDSYRPWDLVDLDLFVVTVHAGSRELLHLARQVAYDRPDRGPCTEPALATIVVGEVLLRTATCKPVAVRPRDLLTEP